MSKAKDISLADIEKFKELFEQKGIPLDEVTIVYMDNKPYYMWPVETALKHKTIGTLSP